MKENRFSPKMISKTDNELKYIIKNRADYTYEAIYAAVKELQNRQIDVENNLIKEIEEKLKNKEENLPDSHLIPKNLLYIVSIVLTPVIIGPLLIFNLWENGNKKGIIATIFYTILYLVFVYAIYLLLGVFRFKPFALFLFNAAATIFIIEYIWNKYLKDN